MSLTFQSASDMLEYIKNNHDLYNTKTGKYVFLYNNIASVCVYYLTEQKAEQLQKQTQQPNAESYWSAYLGCGGRIYDEPENMIWCLENYNDTHWINTEQFDKYKQKG